MNWELLGEVLFIPVLAVLLLAAQHFFWRGLPEKVRPELWEDLIRVFAFPLPIQVRVDMRHSKDPLTVLENYVQGEMSRLRMNGESPKAARIYHAWMRTRAFAENAK